MLGRNQDETEFGTFETSSLNFLYASQVEKGQNITVVIFSKKKQ